MSSGLKNIDDVGALHAGFDISHLSKADISTTSPFAACLSEVGASTTGVYIDDTPVQVRRRVSSRRVPFRKSSIWRRVEILESVLKVRCSEPVPWAHGQVHHAGPGFAQVFGIRARRG